MQTNTPIFLLLDGNALLHRAWHALPPLTTKDGLMVNAVYGFAMIIEKMREQYKPDFMAVAWDLPGKTFRHEKFAAYKATRVKKEQELYDQIPIIQELLSHFHIPSLEKSGYEADDILGTLSNEAQKKHYKTLIVTGDLDALQLVSDLTHVIFFQKGISETKTYDIKAVQERFGFKPEQLIDYKALRGDASDNIPGVVGVGEKTATQLIQKFQSINGIQNALKNGEIEEKLAKKIRGSESVMNEARELVEIVRDLSLPFSFSGAETKEPDWEQVLDMYRKLEFKTLLRKHENKTHAQDSSEKSVKGYKKAEIMIVREYATFQKEFAKFRNSSILACLLAEQSPDLFGATMSVMAFSDGTKTIVVPNPQEIHQEFVRKIYTESSAQMLVTHDLKHFLHQLFSAIAHSPVQRDCFDTSLAAYVLNPSARSYDLPSLLADELHVKIHILPLTFATQKDYQLVGQVAGYLPELSTQLEQKIKQAGLEEVYHQIELPIVPVLFQMEQEGILLDSATLGQFSKTIYKRIAKLESQIYQLAEVEVNVNSPLQLAMILFETLKLPTKGIKKTKSGFSTAASELEKLWDTHPIIPLIAEHRELAKLQSTYVDTLPKLVDKAGRIHTTFQQTVTSTGRLSSSNPNLQNIPVKTELGREIRKAFVAPKKKILIAADYSQIELRLAAVLSEDRVFIEAFQSGADIHTKTAADVWGIVEQKVSKEQRRAAKAINFGILYGMGPRALARSTGFSFEEAKQFIERYFEIHHALLTYLEQTKKQAHEMGYVITMFGRRRYFPEIQSGVAMLVAQAERMAMNMPIQGTAADLMKKAMIAVDGWIRQSKLPIKMLLQVHDELVFEVETEAVEAAVTGIKSIMEGVVTLDVPLLVDVEVGKNWGEMEEWENKNTRW